MTAKGHGIIISVYAAEARSVCDNYKFLLFIIVENYVYIDRNVSANYMLVRKTIFNLLIVKKVVMVGII